MDESQTAITVAVDRVERVAVIGAGTIGASWAACFLANGLDVTVVDPVRDEGELRRAVDGCCLRWKLLDCGRTLTLAG